MKGRIDTKSSSSRSPAKVKPPDPVELRFRSPITTAMPPTTVRLTSRMMRVIPRVVVSSVVVIVLLTLIAATHFERLPKRGLWYAIYWLHDHVFLWIKAYSFTLFYPKSWIWWSLITIISGAALLSWLADHSFIKEPHIFLLRRALRWPVCHPFRPQGK